MRLQLAMKVPKKTMDKRRAAGGMAISLSQISVPVDGFVAR
jgi:hypothetical protein